MSRLCVAVLHFHLRPGGVTRVIERAVESLADGVELLVFSGEAPAPRDALTPITEPWQSLEYADGPPPADAEKLAEDLRFSVKSLFGRDADVWHIHNHSLGKNTFTPYLVKHLAEAGCRVLLQPHDFAEDGRPDNYRRLKEGFGDNLADTLYPRAEHVWYAPINHRDQSFLEAAGLEQVHALPNAVTAHTEVPSEKEVGDAATVVYPARAIRRKNMGEFLLWSLLDRQQRIFQSTLAPKNPQWRKVYDEWVAFAKELNLPVEFDAGRTTDFSTLVREADTLISTSIAEGFGLAFLEPWLESKYLSGRKLPEITKDFEQEGLDLSGLYDTLPIPVEWIGVDTFREALERAMKNSYKAYDQTWEPALLDEACNALIIDGTIDFGRLDEPLQRTVIRHLHEHPEEQRKVPPLSGRPDRKVIEHNRLIVEKRYSLEAYGKRLLSIYQSLAQTKPGPVEYVHPDKLLDQYLKPERFNLLRT